MKKSAVGMMAAWVLSFVSLHVAGITEVDSIQLKSSCPPGFEKVDGKCYLRNLYQLYPSLQGAGVGGLKTGLPPIREGFTPEQIDLGRYLFFDPLLSGDGNLSCASCHHPDFGFSDGLDRSIGITGEKMQRSAPSLWNVGFLDQLFWDARSDTLEDQLTGPLYAMNEMGNTEEKLVSELNGNRKYVELFNKAFASPVITPPLAFIE